MTDRPIIFAPPMVRALIDDKKTQTRRLATSPLRRCEAGDRLYVREAWRTGLAYEDLKPSDLGGEEPVFFEADGAVERWGWKASEPGRLRPGMHMPRWASRLTLIVEGVKVEPLQSIGENDCYCEGLERPSGPRFGSDVCARDNARDWYRELWNSLHTDEDQRWDYNPDVLALTFRVVRDNIDA